MKKKIAIVGPGRVAVRSYLPYLTTRDDVELLYYGRTYSKAVAAAEQFGGKAYEKLGDMMAQSPDAVLVLTMEQDHISAGNQLLDFPVKRIFFEKPLNARNGQANVQESDFFEAADFVKRAKAKGIEMAMNFNYRFYDVSKRIKEEVAKKELGELRQSTWFVNYDTWSHCLDLLSFFGGNVTRVASLARPGQNADLAAAFECDNGGMGTILGTLQHSSYATYYHVVLNFEKANMTFNCLDGELRYFNLENGYFETYNLNPAASQWDKYNASFKKSLDAYLDTIDKNMPPPVSIDAGLKELQLEAALRRSAAEKRPVDFAEFEL